MSRRKRKGNLSQKKKGFCGWLFSIAKRMLVRFDGFLTGKERRRKGNYQSKAKTAQELRDQWQRRCPWWGP